MGNADSYVLGATDGEEDSPKPSVGDDLAPTKIDPIKLSPQSPIKFLGDSVKQSVISLNVKRKAIQDAFNEGGNLVDIKERAMDAMKDYGITNWSKQEDSYLSKIIRGYRTKVLILPKTPELPENAESNQLEEEVQPEPQEGMAMCVVMLDLYPESEGLKCDKGHFICRMALNHYVKVESAKDFDDIYPRRGRMLCPCMKAEPACTSGPYKDHELARIIDPDIFEEYMKQIKRCLYQEAFEEISEKVNKLQKKNDFFETQLMEEQVRLQFQKEDGTFGGYKCPDCGFGPIDHRHCNDLRAHHDANVQGGGVISNACPICGYFTNVLAQWLPWDGEFLRTTPEEAEKIRQRFTTNREEQAQLDALINRLNQRLTPNTQSWSYMAQQLNLREKEYTQRRNWLLMRISRVPDDVEASRLLEALECADKNLKASEIYNVGNFPTTFTVQLNSCRDQVLNEEDEARRRELFPAMIEQITSLEVEISKFVVYLKFRNVVERIGKLSSERMTMATKVHTVTGNVRSEVDEEAAKYTEFTSQAYDSFRSGFGLSSDEEEAESPLVDSQFGNSFKAKEVAPELLKRPTMSVQESRAKLEIVKGRIDEYHAQLDEIESFHVSTLAEDLKREEEEFARFHEFFESVVSRLSDDGKEFTMPDEEFNKLQEGIMQWFEERQEEDNNRVAKEIETLEEMVSALQADIALDNLDGGLDMAQMEDPRTPDNADEITAEMFEGIAVTPALNADIKEENTSPTSPDVIRVMKNDSGLGRQDSTGL